MMSLTKTSDEEGEEDDDDDFKDTISLMEGKVPGAQNGRKAKMEGMYAYEISDPDTLQVIFSC